MPDVVETSSDVVNSTTDLCSVCNDIYVEPDSSSNNDVVWNYRYSKVEMSKRVSIDNELLELVYGHKRCAIQCDNCTRYFIGSRWSAWRAHNQPQVKMEYIHGRINCPSCTADWKEEFPDYVSCDECNQMYGDPDDMFWSELHQDSRCRDCYNNEIECDDCGECFAEEDGHSCDSRTRNYSEHVHSWSYKPDPRFWGEGKYYLGFELEVEDTNDNYAIGAELAHNTLNPMRNRKYRGYLKGDGSLVNGFG